MITISIKMRIRTIGGAASVQRVANYKIWLFAFLCTMCLLTGHFTSKCYAIDTNQQLSQMEQQLFSRSYPSEPQQNRIERLEKTVFGSAQSNQSSEQRLQALGQFFTPSQPVSQGPSRPNYSTQPPPKPDIVQYSPQQNTATETQYPAVSAMEQRVFNRTFEQDTVDVRLARLERRTLGQVQYGTLQERTDQLRMVVLGDTGAGSIATNPQPSGYFPPNGNPSSPQQDATNLADLQQALIPVEKKVLRQTFPNEPVENRLGRLEMKLFNATASDMSPEDRLYRIVGVVNAQGSSRQEQAYGNGPYTSRKGGSPSSGSLGGTFGSMLLMILMSLI